MLDEPCTYYRPKDGTTRYNAYDADEADRYMDALEERCSAALKENSALRGENAILRESEIHRKELIAELRRVIEGGAS